jgi:hypothetical protein
MRKNNKGEARAFAKDDVGNATQSAVAAAPDSELSSAYAEAATPLQIPDQKHLRVDDVSLSPRTKRQKKSPSKSTSVQFLTSSLNPFDRNTENDTLDLHEARISRTDVLRSVPSHVSLCNNAAWEVSDTARNLPLTSATVNTASALAERKACSLKGDTETKLKSQTEGSTTKRDSHSDLVRANIQYNNSRGRVWALQLSSRLIHDFDQHSSTVCVEILRSRLDMLRVCPDILIAETGDVHFLMRKTRSA